jgi:hypothetical protein
MTRSAAGACGFFVLSQLLLGPERYLTSRVTSRVDAANDALRKEIVKLLK